MALLFFIHFLGDLQSSSSNGFEVRTKPTKPVIFFPQRAVRKIRETVTEL